MDCCKVALRQRKRLRAQRCSCAQTSPARSPGNRSTWMVASLFTESFSKLMLAGSVHFVLVKRPMRHRQWSKLRLPSASWIQGVAPENRVENWSTAEGSLHFCGRVVPARRNSLSATGIRNQVFFGGDVSPSSLISAPRNFTGEEARRSTRIERSVPLIVFGQNRMGEPFVERTVSISLNVHGCRYPSRHDYGVGSWITLQVVGLNVEPKPPAVRASVRSVHASQSSRELQQVGVELENPGNVWGIVTPPQDWLGAGATSVSVAPFVTAVAPEQSPATMDDKFDDSPVLVE